MASIQSLGIGSGLLTSELLDDLIAAERAPVENRLDLNKSLVDAKISAYGEVRSALSTLESSLQGLTRTATFNANTATSTDDTLLTATASSLAVAGNYTVSVAALAQSHTIASAAYESVDTALGTGVLTFRLGTTSYDEDGSYQSFALNAAAKSKSVVISASNNTLGGIRDAVNAASFGVQASIVDDGSGYRLLFTSRESGANQSIEVTATGTTGLKALNYNLNSETVDLQAVLDAGSVDLGAGAGLAAAARTFGLTYKGTALEVLVADDPGITDTDTAIAAIQNALDAELIDKGFAAGALVVSGDDDVLNIASAGSGFSETLKVDSDGAPAVFEAGALSDGFDFSANNASFTITVDGTDTHAIVLNTATATREGTVALINQALLDAGIDDDVSASLNAANELIFTRSSSGASGSLQISDVDAGGTAASSELGLAAGTAVGLDGFGLNTAAGSVTGSARMEQAMAGQDARFSVNGINVTRSSNLAVGVVPGTTLNLKAVTPGPVTLSIAKDPSTTITRIQGFVDAYNSLKSLSNSLTEFNPGTGENGQGSLLTGDTTMRFISNEINSLLRSSISGLDSSLSSLADIGITTNQDSGYMLEFDIATFSKEFEESPEDVLALFASSGRTTDSLIEYTGISALTQPGTYAVEITRLATVGSYEGAAVSGLAAGNILIDDANNSFTIELNGFTADIVLTNGTYDTASAVAEQIQLQINSSDDLSRAGNAVEVTYDEDAGRFLIESSLYGSESRVRFLDAGTAVADTLGLLVQGEGDFRGNQLAGLATASGDSAESFTTAVEINTSTSFKVSINGEQSALITLPGESGAPQSYASPDDLIAALKAQIDADPMFLDPEVPELFVEYSYNADTGLGRLVFTTGSHGDEIEVASTTAGAASKLGLFIGNGAFSRSTTGVDVAGTINGIEAEGLGQTLVAAAGNVPAEPGFYLHAPHGNLALSTASDSFTIAVDGTTSGPISLGVLSDTDPVAVALGMQVAINNSPALIAAGVSVTVEYDTNTGGFGIISNSSGSNSSVEIVGLAGNAASILGFSAGRGDHGRAGRNASGSPDDSAGLRLEITGGDLGARGTVSFSRGVADRLDALLESYLGNSGLLSNRTEALNTELETIAEKRVALDARIARSEERLRASFLANDLIINRLNTTADFLTSQLEMLEALATSTMKGK